MKVNQIIYLLSKNDTVDFIRYKSFLSANKNWNLCINWYFIMQLTGVFQ